MAIVLPEGYLAIKNSSANNTVLYDIYDGTFNHPIRTLFNNTAGAYTFNSNYILRIVNDTCEVYCRNICGTQATNITFSNITNNQFIFNWIDGNGSSRVAFIKEGSDGAASPINNTTYTANTAFGSGSQIGTTGWYCVFNGTTHAAGVTVTNLSPCKTYRVMVCEYTGAVGSEIYNTSTAIKNPENVQTSGSTIIPTDGLLAYYPFNGNANDESGNGNNGVVNGATLTNDRFGNANKSYSFDGIDDWIDVNYNENLFPQIQTISLWIFAENSNSYSSCILRAGNASNDGWRGYSISPRNFETQYGYTDFNGSDYCLTLVQPINEWLIRQWFHLIIVRNNNSGDHYINGNLVSSANTQGVYQPPLYSKLFIGSNHLGDNGLPFSFFNGFLDDIRIYNRALTVSEIQALYHEGEQQPLIVTSPNGGERWKVGDIRPITWTSCGADNVKIEYSINSGTNWTTIINETPASAGSYSWTVPDTPSDICIVKITSTTDETVFDQSDAVFTIYEGTNAQITVTSPTATKDGKLAMFTR
ncbi:MAG: hypothetical protein M0P58_08935 [Bacteroidales bacterium]|nr:hypothetical protein [Bacteroidales bacterium]